MRSSLRALAGWTLATVALGGCQNAGRDGDAALDGGRTSHAGAADATAQDSASLDASSAGDASSLTDRDATLDANDTSATGCDALALQGSDYDAVFEIGTRLQAGQEREICALYRTPDHDIWMNWSELAGAKGAHHGVLWLTSLTKLPEVDGLGEPIKLGKVVTCPGNVNRFDPASKPISGSQGGGNLFSPKGVLPPDVAIHVPAGSYVVADLHVLNITSAPIEPCMKVGLRGIPERQVAQEAGPLLLSNAFINAPAHAPKTARMACPMTRDIALRTAVSHMHERGVGYTARWLSGDPYASGTKLQRVLYETTDWSSPVDTVFDEPLRIQKGDWIDFECRYQNPADHNVAQGTEAADEMCLFMGIFWPYDQALAHCGRNAHDDGGAAYQIGDGTVNGTDFIDCFWTNLLRPGALGPGTAFSELTPAEYDARYDFQGCFADACEPIGRFTRPYVNCVGDNLPVCQGDCGGEVDAIDAACKLDAASLGGCAEAYGSDGSDGTCATSAATVNAAQAHCTTTSASAAIEATCRAMAEASGGCATACGGVDAVACANCLGSVDFDAANTSCLNAQALTCAAQEVTTLATTCTTACLGDCVGAHLDACVLDCLHAGPCETVHDALVGTACK